MTLVHTNTSIWQHLVSECSSGFPKWNSIHTWWVDHSWRPEVWTIAHSPNGSVSTAPGGLDGQPWWSSGNQDDHDHEGLGKQLSLYRLGILNLYRLSIFPHFYRLITFPHTFWTCRRGPCTHVITKKLWPILPRFQKRLEDGILCSTALVLNSLLPWCHNVVRDVVVLTCIQLPCIKGNQMGNKLQIGTCNLQSIYRDITGRNQSNEAPSGKSNHIFQLWGQYHTLVSNYDLSLFVTFPTHHTCELRRSH